MRKGNVHRYTRIWEKEALTSPAALPPPLPLILWQMHCVQYENTAKWKADPEDPRGLPPYPFTVKSGARHCYPRNLGPVIALSQTIS